MHQPIVFSKLSGSGNDFACIDNRSGRYDEMLGDAARVAHFGRALCNRAHGIGADGVIFATRPEVEGVSDIAAKFIEADGTEVELCGNGTACFVHWASVKGIGPKGEMRILTPAGVVRGSNSTGEYVRVCIPTPKDIRRDLELDARGRTWRCDFAVTGIPHLVAYVDDVEEIDVPRVGKALRHHQQFAPRGVNANFVQVIGEGEIAVRTFEFGVEGETFACGTGSAAAAILTATRLGWDGDISAGKKPVLIRAHSGDVLKVYFTMDSGGQIADVCLETIVRYVYDGTLHPDLAANAMGSGGK